MIRTPSHPNAGIRRGLLALALALAAAAVPGAARAQDASLPPALDGGGAPILPGDMVRLTVWRHEDLTGEFLVNEFGTVVIPKLGEIDVRRETHRSLRDRVIQELRETVVSSSIELVVLKRVRVLGQVGEPGLYYLDPTMTVADALAMASGTTPDARQGPVILRRGSEVVVADLRLDLLISDTPIRSYDELYVPQRAWLSRNANAVVAGTGAFVGLLVAVITSRGGDG